MSRNHDRLAGFLARTIFDSRDTKWLIPVLSSSLPMIFVVLAGSLLAAALGLAMPMLTKQVIDTGIVARDMGALVTWSLTSFVFGLLLVVLGIGNSMIHLRASARMLARLRTHVHAALMRPDPVFPDLPLGEAMARLDGDSAEIQRFAFDTVLVAIGAVFRLGGGMVLMALLDWRMVLLPLLLAPAELAFLAYARPKTQALAEEVRNQRGQLSAVLTENLATRPQLAALDALGMRSGLMEARQEVQIKGLIRQRLWAESVTAISQIIAAIMRSMVLLVGGWLVISGEWQLGTLIAYLAYANMMQGPLRNMLGLYHAQARSKVAVARLADIFRQSRPDEGEDIGQDIRKVSLIGLRGKGGRHAPLDGVMLPASKVLVDGPSGVGKTRLLSVLTRAAPADCGQALLDGVDVATIKPSALTGAILHLPQRPLILRGTLRENLQLGQHDTDSPAMWDALRKVGLADWAAGKNGLDTDLAETGADLSGGMRQRLSLARAFLSDHRIIIFDESFSEIDTPSCRLILKEIEALSGDRLLIFVSHSGPVRDLTFDQTFMLSFALSEASGSP